MSVKIGLIEAIRNTPDGIKNFLNVAIPSLVATTDPTSKDNQNILAHNLNTILMLFNGLTPVEMVLRVGQHSNVSEAILLSCLEYMQDTEKDHKIELQHPKDGGIYFTGDLQIIVKELNGTPKRVTATLGDTSIDLDGQAGFWVGTVTLETEADYTLNITAEYEKGDDATVNAVFTIALTADPEDPQPEPPGGKDKAAANAAKITADESYITFVAKGANSDNWDEWKTKGNIFVAIAQAAATNPEDLTAIVARIEGIKDTMDGAIQDEAPAEDLILIAGTLQAAYNQLQLAI